MNIIIVGGFYQLNIFSFNRPKKITTAMQIVSPEFHPTSPVPIATDTAKPKNKGTQSLYR